MVALLGFAALAVDAGMLYTADIEAQRGADAIALAGASSFLANAPSNWVADAKSRAREYAALNTVRNVAIDTVTIDEAQYSWESSEVRVDVILDSMKVRATVRRQGIGLWFAAILGDDFAAVAATATAQAAQAGAAACMVPFAIPVPPGAQMTLGQEMMLKSADSSVIAEADPFFAPFSLPADENVMPYCPRATGLQDQAWGRTNNCTSCSTQNGRFPGESFGGWHQATPVNAWMNGVENPEGSFYPGNGYAENICGDNCSPVDAGSEQTIITGDMDGPTAWGVNARLAQDADAWWNPSDDRIWRGNAPLEDYNSSPRVVKVPTFDPADITHASDRNFNINGFAFYFLERGPQHGFYDPTDQLEIQGRFLYHAPGTESGNSPYSRILRLVE
jgi:hypothetical protein